MREQDRTSPGIGAVGLWHSAAIMSAIFDATRDSILGASAGGELCRRVTGLLSHGLHSWLPFPEIDPIAFTIWGVSVRWYALAYILGVVAGLILGVWMSRDPKSGFDRDQALTFPTWVLVGIVVGGRLGYVLFYKPRHFFEYPGDIIAVWQGGMSFHGGLIGVVLATFLFCWIHKIKVAAMTDFTVLAAPIGLFLGRIANFINGELWGRTTDHWIGMVFPTGGPEPRHPSQLYEAATEGILLFAVLWILKGTVARDRPHGFLSGAFLIGYGLARSFCEFFREPDAHLGFVLGPFTMGQLLSVPLILAGIALIYFTGRRGADEPPAAAAST